MRQRIYEIVGKASDYDYASRAYDIFIVVVALLSLVPLMFDEAAIPEWASNLVRGLDIVTAYILVFDYLLRWMTHDLKTDKGIKAFFIYPFTPMAIIDLLAILPTLRFVPQFFRFLRILRIVKVFRYSRNLVVITNACYREAKTLRSVLIVACIYIVTVALIVWMCEPTAFTDFFDAICWATTVLTSVGFEDQRPLGYVGRFVSVASSLMGILLIALPAGIITGAYLAEAHAASNKSGYFRMVGPTKKRLRDYESLPSWLESNRKIARYATIIIASTILSLLFSATLGALNYSTSFDQIGPALAAFLLEPAAGIFVAFFTSVVSSIYNNDTVEILYILHYGLTAIAFGVVFPHKSSSHKVLRTLAVFLILVFACGTIDGAVVNVEFDYNFEEMFAYYPTAHFVLSHFGFDMPTSLVLGVYLGKAIEAILLIVLANIFILVARDRVTPSSVEVEQQQEILLERALKQEELDKMDSRTVFKESLLKKQRELSEQQHEISKELNMVNKRLDEIAAEESLEQL